MSTRFGWMTPITHSKEEAQKEYDHIKEVLFGGYESDELQLATLGRFYCVVFTTRASSAQDPFTTFYRMDTHRLVCISDEETGFYLT